MITIAEARESIGRGVVYQPAGGGIPEWGVITSVGLDGLLSPTALVFVHYSGDHGSKATRPEDLVFGYLTKSGRVLTDEEIERLAVEAETLRAEVGAPRWTTRAYEREVEADLGMPLGGVTVEQAAELARERSLYEELARAAEGDAIRAAEDDAADTSRHE